MTDDAVTVPLGIPRRRRPRPYRLVALVAGAVAIGAAVLAAVLFPLSPTSTASDLSSATPGGPAAAGVPATGPSRTARTEGGVAPALTDDAGHALPTSAVAGIRAVFRALQDGDVTAVGARYRPSEIDASSWALLAPRVELKGVRTRLLSAMQERPSRAEDTDILYGSSRYFVGFSDDGSLTYIQADQEVAPATTSATSSSSRFPTSTSDPYGCLAADRALYAGLIGYAQHPCEAHFQNQQDPTEMQPDTPATRWSFCHLPVRANDPSDVVRARERYC